MSTRVTSKGQVTIPKRVREALGITPGSQVDFVLEEGRVVLAPVAGGVNALAGSLKKYIRKGMRIPDRVVMEEVRREVAHAAAHAGRNRRHKRSS
jgi:antitoxin PrlF